MEKHLPLEVFFQSLLTAGGAVLRQAKVCCRPARAGAPSPDAGKDMFECPFADSAREPEKAEGWRKAAG